MFKSAVFILLICSLQVACTAMPTEALTATETLLWSSATATVEPKVNLPAEASIIYRRSGGLAGLDEIWTIYPNGRVTKTLHPQGEGLMKEWQVPAADVAALISQLKELGFFELTGSYKPLDTCCDRITYDIEARSGNQVNHLLTLDAAPDVPAELWLAIDFLNTFISRFGK